MLYFHGVLVVVAVILTHYARSAQIAAAARLIAIVWFFSLQLPIIMDEPMRHIACAALDFVLAVAFYRMSRRRCFPVPLLHLSGILCCFHVYDVFLGRQLFWVQMFLNGTFGLALAYIIACAAYRIVVLRAGAAE